MLPTRQVQRIILQRVNRKRLRLPGLHNTAPEACNFRPFVVLGSFALGFHSIRLYSEHISHESEITPTHGGIWVPRTVYEQTLASQKHPEKKSDVALSFMKSLYKLDLFESVLVVFEDLRRLQLPIHNLHVCVAASSAIRLDRDQAALDQILATIPKPVPSIVLKYMINAYVKQRKFKEGKPLLIEIGSRIFSDSDQSMLDNATSAIVNFYTACGKTWLALHLFQRVTRFSRAPYEPIMSGSLLLRKCVESHDKAAVTRLLAMPIADRLLILPGTANLTFKFLWDSNMSEHASDLLDSLETRSQTDKHILRCFRDVMKSIATTALSEKADLSRIQSLRMQDRLVQSMDWSDFEALLLLVRITIMEHGFSKALTYIYKAVRKNPSTPSHTILGPTLSNLVSSSPDLIPHAVRIITLFPELDIANNYKYYDSLLASVDKRQTYLFWEECRLQYSEAGVTPSRQREIAIANGRLKHKCYSSNHDDVRNAFFQLLDSKTYDSTTYGIMIYYFLDKKMLSEGQAFCASWMKTMPFDVFTASVVIESLFRFYATHHEKQNDIQRLYSRIVDSFANTPVVPVEDAQSVFRAATFSSTTSTDLLDNWKYWLAKSCIPEVINCIEVLEALDAIGDSVLAARFAFAFLDATAMPLEKEFLWQLQALVLPQARRQLGLPPPAVIPLKPPTGLRELLQLTERQDAQAKIAEVIPYDLLSVPIIDTSSISSWKPGAPYVYHDVKLRPRPVTRGNLNT